LLDLLFHCINIRAQGSHTCKPVFCTVQELQQILQTTTNIKDMVLAKCGTVSEDYSSGLKFTVSRKSPNKITLISIHEHMQLLLEQNIQSPHRNLITI
jgi:hypothetical protein